ncbi:MAG: HAD family phosphatase [Prevotella sp.]|nr:HAD family phosphatase [Prevotella sp.]MBQ6210641.1 HAD family phosphatase [Prevotella sp.]
MEGVRNIIFDLGGVLAGLDGQRCIDAFDALGCEKVSYYVEHHLTEDLFYNIEVGNISTEDFCDEVRRITGRNVSDEQIVWAWNQLLTGISERRLEKLLRLRGKYHLFLLSNTNDMHWQLCVDDFFTFRGNRVENFFDRIFLSYKMHLSKPSKDIYEEVLRQANIQPAETLFIDDSKTNIEGASPLGIQGYWNAHINDWLALDL